MSKYHEYSYDEYQEKIQEISRRPMKPKIGIPLFLFALSLALVAKHYFGAVFAGLAVLFLLFLFPYYVVQLLLEWRMHRHLMKAKRAGIKPIYVPSDPRGWAGVYGGVFMAEGLLLFAFYKLLGLD